MALPNWACAQIVNGEVVDHKPFKKHVVFLVCNDNGRNGYYEQKKYRGNDGGILRNKLGWTLWSLLVIFIILMGCVVCWIHCGPSNF